MSTIRLDFVSQDHMVFSGDVREIIAPGIDGQLGILPHHAPLMTILSPGEVVVRSEGKEDQFFAVSGGWMEVRPDKVTILARSAERSDEIDLKRAEAARRVPRSSWRRVSSAKSRPAWKWPSGARKFASRSRGGAAAGGRRGPAKQRPSAGKANRQHPEGDAKACDASEDASHASFSACVVAFFGIYLLTLDAG